jgi:hypothetical protein
MTVHSALHARIQNEYMAKWKTCPDDFPDSKRQFSYFVKRIWEIKFNHFLRAIKKEFKCPKLNKRKLLERSKYFFEESLAYPHEQLTLIFSNEILIATKDFIRKAGEFDKELSQNEIFQALRNVWVMLGLQSFFGKEIKITPSLLAYSLLYPYTDNLIDSPTISKSEKLEFCTRFALRLDGKPAVCYVSNRKSNFRLS